eukprot:10622439-Alexandrium_andersonii.AAC.1
MGGRMGCIKNPPFFDTHCPGTRAQERNAFPNARRSIARACSAAVLVTWAVLGSCVRDRAFEKAALCVRVF